MSRPQRRCLDCGRVTRAGSRCAPCETEHEAATRDPFLDSPEWRGLRARVLRAWRAEHGNLCPGYRRPPHPDPDLTVAHKVARALEPTRALDPANVGVLCRSCNSRQALAPDTRPGDPETEQAASPRRRVGMARIRSSEPRP